jgi:hypothetical protein
MSSTAARNQSQNDGYSPLDRGFDVRADEGQGVIVEILNAVPNALPLVGGDICDLDE